MSSVSKCQVYPGETIRTDIWRSDDEACVSFRATVIERETVVLNNGRAVLGDAAASRGD